MRKFLISLLLLILLPISVVLIWIGYSEIVIMVVWAKSLSNISIFYILLGCIGALLLWLCIELGFRENPGFTGVYLMMLSILGAGFVFIYLTLPFLRSLAVVHFSDGFINQLSIARASMLRTAPVITPGLVHEWQTIELINTIVGGLLFLFLFSMGLRGYSLSKKP